MIAKREAKSVRQGAIHFVNKPLCLKRDSLIVLREQTGYYPVDHFDQNFTLAFGGRVRHSSSCYLNGSIQ